MRSGLARCAIVSWNTTLVRCVSPRGAGAAVALSTWTPTHATVPQRDAALSFRPPVLLSVSPRELEARGGQSVTLVGSDFSGAPTVTIGGAPAAVISLSPQESVLTVLSPAGVGEALNVTVTAAGGRATSVPYAVGYAAPVITAFNVSALDGARGGVLGITGSNFGPPGTRVSVDLGPVSCMAPAVVHDALVACVVPPSVPVTAALGVSLARAGQAAAPAHLPVVCPPGYYGAEDEVCAACPVGAACAGGAAEPCPLAGYARAARAGFLLCVPREACVALPPSVATARLAAGVPPATAFRNCGDGCVCARGGRGH